MKRYCGKCGTPLDERTGKCPKCGTGKRRFFFIGTTAILALAVVIFVFIRFHTPEPVTMESGSPISESSTEPSTKPPEPTVAKKPEPRPRTQMPPPTATEPAALESFLPSEIPDYAAAYLQVIQETEGKFALGYGYPFGELYDLNSDGVPEMALCYPIMIEEPYITEDGKEEIGEIFHRECDLYTFRDGMAVPLLEQKAVSAFWDGSYGRFAFIEKDGKKSFFWETSSSGMNSVSYYSLRQERYSMVGNELICDGVYECGRIKSSENGETVKTSYTVNGTETSKAGFDKWYESNISVYSPSQNNVACTSGVPLVQFKKELALTGGALPLLVPLSGDKHVKSAAVCASRSNDILNYEAEKLLDNDLKTNWAGEKSYFEETENLTFDLDEKLPVYGICIWAGNHCDIDHYKENTRLMAFHVTAGDGTEQDFYLRDIMGGQIVLFDKPINTDNFKIEFEDHSGAQYVTYGGRDGKHNIVVSEIDFLTAEKMEKLADMLNKRETQSPSRESVPDSPALPTGNIGTVEPSEIVATDPIDEYLRIHFFSKYPQQTNMLKIHYRCLDERTVLFDIEEGPLAFLTFKRGDYNEDGIEDLLVVTLDAERDFMHKELDQLCALRCNVDIYFFNKSGTTNKQYGHSWGVELGTKEKYVISETAEKLVFWRSIDERYGETNNSTGQFYPIVSSEIHEENFDFLKIGSFERLGDIRREVAKSTNGVYYSADSKTLFDSLTTLGKNYPMECTSEEEACDYICDVLDNEIVIPDLKIKPFTWENRWETDYLQPVLTNQICSIVTESSFSEKVSETETGGITSIYINVPGNDVNEIGNGIFWQLDTVGTLKIWGTGEIPDFEYYEENSRSSVTSPWDDVRNQVRSVKIEAGISRIGSRAFEYFNHLTSIEIPDTVTSIGENAFRDCNSLERVSLPNSITEIGKEAFYHCGSLSNILIPKSVVKIGNSAFSGTSLGVVKISENCQLGNSVFPEKCKVYYY